jgi:holin-like protein
MKYLSQFGIILAISFVGEVLNIIIRVPIPASIYGMVLLFVGLLSGGVKLSSVKDTGKFLIEIMPLLFIPATVGLIESWALMQDFLVAIIVISLVSTVVVAAAAGRITQFIINRKTKK